MPSRKTPADQESEAGNPRDDDRGDDRDDRADRDERRARSTPERAAAEAERGMAELRAPRTPAATATAADKTQVNEQVLDSLDAIEAADETTAVLRAGLPQVAAQAVGLALLNAVNAQQNAYVTANATVLATVNRILALRSAEPAAPAGDAASG